jgi:arylsulfatase A-like enzyme
MKTRPLLFLLLAPLVPVQAATAPKTNVLMIVIDDQNGYAGRTEISPQAVTPQLDRFAKGGMLFANAQCAAPVCNPSRTAFMSGLRPSTSGIYDNSQDDLPKDHLLKSSTSLPTYFRDQGYHLAGAGKVFSSAIAAAAGKRIWAETIELGRKAKKHAPAPEGEGMNAIGKHAWGPLYKSKEEMEDWKLAGWAADFLTKPQSEPFFLACGIVKPHTPWYVPQEYFDLFPPESITVPDLAADESAGLPESVREKPHKTEAQLIQRRKELISAYLAASRYADDCVGRILQGLAQGPNRENTIVVIFGDNGYEFGEKNNWSKGSLREGSAHVPLVIAGPGIAPQQTCTHPVSLLDLYPTLVELAGLPAKSGLDGVSLVPLLKNPAAPWERPALTTAGFKNHALRTDRWRYIRYADGAEELYDHAKDPLERSNLANQPESAKIKSDLQQWLPRHDEPRNPDSKGGKGED